MSVFVFFPSFRDLHFKRGVFILLLTNTVFVLTDSVKASCGPCTTASVSGLSTERFGNPFEEIIIALQELSKNTAVLPTNTSSTASSIFSHSFKSAVVIPPSVKISIAFSFVISLSGGAILILIIRFSRTVLSIVSLLTISSIYIT